MLIKQILFKILFENTNGISPPDVDVFPSLWRRWRTLDRQQRGIARFSRNRFTVSDEVSRKITF